METHTAPLPRARQSCDRLERALGKLLRELSQTEPIQQIFDDDFAHIRAMDIRIDHAILQKLKEADGGAWIQFLFDLFESGESSSIIERFVNCTSSPAQLRGSVVVLVGSDLRTGHLISGLDIPQIVDPEWGFYSDGEARVISIQRPLNVLVKSKKG